MNMTDYQIDTYKIFQVTRLDDPVLGLAGECGEVIELVKKDRRPGEWKKPMSQEKLTKEIGDVLFYLTQIATEYDIDMADVADANLVKLRDRYKNLL